MEATQTEITILKYLSGCRYLPGSFDKKFPRQIDPKNVSPLQKWWIYKLGYKYRKQIGQDWITNVCQQYIAENEKPLTRREAEKVLKAALKAQQNPELEL